MNAAIIGYGYWGKIIQKEIESRDDLIIKKIYSPKLEDIGIYCSDENEVFNDNEIECVFICSPLETHYNYARRALINHKHVFCEKPTTSNLKEFYELMELAKINIKTIFTDYIHIFSPSVNYVKKNINRIGKILHIESTIAQYGKFYSHESVYQTIGVHLISIILYILNEKIIHVNKTDYISQNNCVFGNIKIEFQSGINANITCNLISSEKVRHILIYGDQGYIDLNINEKSSINIYQFSNAQFCNNISKIDELNLDDKNGIKRSINEFLNNIKNALYTPFFEISEQTIIAVT